MTRSRAAFIFIFITVLLDMVSFGVIIPVFPQLILRLHRRPGHRRSARSDRPPRAVLVLGGALLRELPLRAADPSRIAAAGAPRSIPSARGKPHRSDALPRLATGPLHPRCRRVLREPLTRRASEHVRPLRHAALEFRLSLHRAFAS